MCHAGGCEIVENHTHLIISAFFGSGIDFIAELTVIVGRSGISPEQPAEILAIISDRSPLTRHLDHAAVGIAYKFTVGCRMFNVIWLHADP